ncbi:hypothetical protein Tco_0255413, partial [Tanacetum coccineum]
MLKSSLLSLYLILLSHLLSLSSFIVLDPISLNFPKENLAVPCRNSPITDTLVVKGTDIPSYTLRFQELALICGRMFPKEYDEVEKYVSGLPNLIRGNVMSYRPQTMEE